MKFIYRVLLSASLLCASSAVSAHHSFAAHFHSDQVVEVTGTVKNFFWTNPHAFIFLEVVNAAGETEEWRLEMSNTIGLSRRGWNKTTIATGDRLHVTGNPARVASRHMIHVKTLQREADGFEYSSESR
ncbi:MAG: hypothetical protein HW386_959 [Gammaproteobacteria bacterium]|nr:hypothetical protein [Gammaproteobacteria bacterium]